MDKMVQRLINLFSKSDIANAKNARLPNPQRALSSVVSATASGQGCLKDSRRSHEKKVAEGKPIEWNGAEMRTDGGYEGNSMRAICACSLAFPLAVLVGCGGNPSESITGDGISTTVSHRGEFELNVTGNQCSVIVSRGTVRSLTVRGNGNVVTLKPQANLVSGSMTGNGNRLKIPRGTTWPMVSHTGNDNTVVEE